MSNATATTKQMTVMELRLMLFALENQEMTIKQLRKKLWDIEDQNKPIEIEEFMWRQLGL